MGNTQEPARIFDIDWAGYRAIARMNPSTIVHGFNSMKELLAVMEGGFYEESNAMRLGTGIHALTLEPDEFKDRFAIIPDFHKDPQNKTSDGTRSESKATRYYKESVADFMNANRGKSIMDSSDYRKALRAVLAISGHRLASSLIQHSKKEQTVIGEICGVPFKGRIDLLDLEMRGCITDVKTSQSCDPWLFGRVCRNLRYPHKMAIYRELVRQAHGITLDVKVIVQETSKAFDTVVYPLKAEKLDTVFEEVCAVIERYKQAQVEDYWPGIDEGRDELELPDMAYGYSQPEDEFVDWEALNEDE
jgi:hypothetical protein